MRLIIPALAIVLSAPTQAGSLEDGLAAYHREDYTVAERLLRPLAEQGNAPAQVRLGIMYHSGEGIPQNFAEAERWYRKAAEQGNVDALFNLGFMYHLGDGVPQDFAESVEWYRRAGQRGHAFSQVQVGIAYENGQGVPQDYAQAHMWFNIAAANGDTLGVRFRDNLASRLTPAQIAEAQKLAREWVAKHKK